MALVPVVCGIAALVTALLVAAYPPNPRPAAAAPGAGDDMAGAEADGRQ